MKQLLSASRKLVLILAAHALGCGGTETTNPVGGDDHPAGVQVLRSSKAYVTGANPPATDVESLRSGARAFALDLYRQAAARALANENLLLGTHSVNTLLAMTSAGARGTTQAELAEVLKHGLSQVALHPAMNQLTQDLQASIAGSDVQYQPLPSIWLRKGAQVEDAFLDTLAEDYDARVFLADFAGNPETARSNINDWVSKQTKQLIPELFAAGTIDPRTELVLTSAAYLSAPWQDRLDPDLTKTQEFSLPDGSVVDVPMMSREWRYPFAFDIDWRALELPSTAPEVSMVFVLPNAGEFSEFESSFDAAMLEKIVAGLDKSRSAPHDITVYVPRFGFSSNVDLQPSLQGLGMPTAFDEDTADFSGIEPKQQLYVSRFVHQTTVAVDENGTTAAASTGEVHEPSGIAPQINLNRPFLFFIYDRGSGSVLFVGRLLRPAGDAHAPAQTAAPMSDADALCSSLANRCQSRTTTQAACQSALAADSADAIRRCADCVRLGTDECGAYGTCAWSHGDICDPATCASHCPGHDF